MFVGVGPLNVGNLPCSSVDVDTDMNMGMLHRAQYYPQHFLAPKKDQMRLSYGLSGAYLDLILGGRGLVLGSIILGGVRHGTL